MSESVDEGLDGGISARQEADQTEQDDEEVLGYGPAGSVGPEGDELQDGRKDESQEGAAEGANERDEKVQFRDQSREWDWSIKKEAISKGDSREWHI